ncbi:cell division protein FtsQ/DivIB [Candidatus Anaplasma sp. TIGMIC]|uniref:cell division protein FtsQ/DivIB n=1 Tax=Candidatus Anaplasma sp. TIGMIC TaxID=3020713 RepID=UPI002331524B|nr:FtsQ-type POTRA domain-containing protein [Candidatus Anaplasma sp. TIGMIC]MDB1135547.1 FtsQ-type POTRA domain-containing protein [Candidatus Anaplasma sp. TIGMIC]
MYFELAVKKVRAAIYKIKQELSRPFWRGIGLLSIAIVLIMCIVVPRLQRGNKVSHGLSHAMVSMGLPVRNVIVHGNNMIATEDIIRTVAHDRPILLIPLKKLSELIRRSSPWVKSVTVSRVIYNGTLNISVEEYKAFANWVHDGSNSIIDEAGYVILNSPERFKNLVSLYGDKAPDYLEFVREVLGSGDILSTMISSFSLLDDGRWNVNLSSGLQIRLPEQDPKLAWKHVQQLHGSYEDLLMWKEIDASIPGGVAVQK